MNPTLVGALITGGLGFAGLICAGLISLNAKVRELRLMQKTAAGAQHIGEWQQYREDNKNLREQNDDLEKKIDRLNSKVEALELKIDSLVETKHDVEAQRDIALADAAAWRVRYERERLISQTYSSLWDCAQEGRVPDDGLLSMIRRQLAEAGVGAAPAAAAAQPAVQINIAGPTAKEGT